MGGAGALACMIPAAELTLTTSMLVTRNIYGKTIGQNASEEKMNRLARIMVIVLTGLALFLAIFYNSALVNLLLNGYTGVTQFFPMLVLGLYWKKSTKIAAFTSLIIGEGLVVYWLMIKKMSVIPVPALGGHVNTGFVALLITLSVFVVVSLLTQSTSNKVIRS